MAMLNFEGKTEEHILKEMEKLAGGDERFPPFDAMKAFIQVRTVGKLCQQIAALEHDFVTQGNSLKDNLDKFRDSLDKLRTSNDESAGVMKKWTKALATATIVLAGATVVLAIATIILALK